jgi:hypothetical protein
MNFNIARNTRPLTNAAANVSAASSNMLTGMFSKFWAVMVLILVVFVAMVIYYKTIGYYLEIGWSRIYAMITGGTDINAEIGGENGLSADLKPMDGPPAANNMPPADARPPGMPGATDGTSFLPSLSIGGPKKEVFNVSRNIYTYNDAAAVCEALGAELANYEQVQESHAKGADWCNYGWTKGQLAVYPTQKSTWEKLQKGPAEYRNACGRPGVNGGYFDNPELRFGVNCYGIKPPRNATDELLESQVALPPTPDQIEFEKKVQKYREQLNTITVLPFQKGQWTE